MTSHIDDLLDRASVEDYVDLTLAGMPEHLRAGVAAESLAFASWNRVTDRGGNRLAAQIESWRHSKIDLMRQYVRLLESLVLFAENELAST